MRPAPGPIYGAQDSSVPVSNGCIPDAPVGGHSTQAGALIAGAAVALPEDPAEEAGDDDVERAVLVALGSAVEAAAVPVAAPADAAPVDAAPEAPVVVAGDVDVGRAAAAGLAVAVDAVGLGVPMARLTTPLTVTVPGAAAVCAAAGNATPSDNSTA